MIRDTNRVIFRTLDSIIDSCLPRSALLFEGEFLGAGYFPERNGKNNVYQDIHIAETNYYTIGSLRSALETHLVSPLQYNLIDKQNDEPDANEKDRVPAEVSVVMCDHEIYFPDAHQHDHKCIEDLEIGRIIGDPTQHDILHHPDQRDQYDKQVKEKFPLPQQAPNVELPGDQDPLQQAIDIVGYAVEMHRLEKNITDQLIQYGKGQHQQEGPVRLAQAAVTYQPYDKWQEFEFTQ
jgi:hypothetical protein